MDYQEKIKQFFPLMAELQALPTKIAEANAHLRVAEQEAGTIVGVKKALMAQLNGLAMITPLIVRLLELEPKAAIESLKVFPEAIEVISSMTTVLKQHIAEESAS